MNDWDSNEPTSPGWYWVWEPDGEERPLIGCLSTNGSFSRWWFPETGAKPYSGAFQGRGAWFLPMERPALPVGVGR